MQLQTVNAATLQGGKALHTPAQLLGVITDRVDWRTCWVCSACGVKSWVGAHGLFSNLPGQFTQIDFQAHGARVRLRLQVDQRRVRLTELAHGV